VDGGPGRIDLAPRRLPAEPEAPGGLAVAAPQALVQPELFAARARAVREARPDRVHISPDLLRRGLDAHEPESSPGRRDRDADLLDGLRGGTLLLDELGDLAPDVQAQLGQLARRLARLPAGADVRLVSMTQRDLQAVVDAERFRPDLYYTRCSRGAGGGARGSKGANT
jgi:hypothetical protein